ncbi:MAG: hypothetical protein AAF658_13085, partial [Myxococcota bacterium]
MPADLNADGIVDFLDDQGTAYVAAHDYPDLITTIWDGLNPDDISAGYAPSVKVNYDAATSLVSGDCASVTHTAWTRCSAPSSHLVSSIEYFSGGPGGQVRSYEYAAPLMHAVRGFLGFGEIVTADSLWQRTLTRKFAPLPTAEVATEWYRKDETQADATTTLSTETTTNWLARTVRGDTPQIFADGVTTEFKENGVSLWKTSVSRTVDTFANETFRNRETWLPGTPADVLGFVPTTAWSSSLVSLWQNKTVVSQTSTYDMHLEKWLVERRDQVTTTRRSALCSALQAGGTNLLPDGVSAADACDANSGNTTSVVDYGWYASEPHRLEYMEAQPATPNALRIDLEYDSWGNVRRTASSGRVDSAGATQVRATTVLYDPEEHLFPIQQTFETDTDPLITRWIYEQDLGLHVGTVSPSGQLSIYAVDGFGKPVATFASGQSASTFTWSDTLYSSFGTSPFSLHAKSTTGRESIEMYDRLGRMTNRQTRIDAVTWGTSRVQYDGRGFAVRRSDSFDATSSTPIPWFDTQFDNFGRVVQTEDVDGTSTLHYDGWSVEERRNSRTRRRLMNGDGGLIASIDRAGMVDRYFYDAFGGVS